jgi:hypothetical protein
LKSSSVSPPLDWFVPFMQTRAIPMLLASGVQLIAVSFVCAFWPRRTSARGTRWRMQFGMVASVAAASLVLWPTVHHTLFVFWHELDEFVLRSDFRSAVHGKGGSPVSLYTVGAFGLMLVSPVGHFVTTRLLAGRYIESRFDVDEDGRPVCQACGYRPGAVAGSRCPECGRDLEASARRARRSRAISASLWILLVVALALFPLLWAMLGRVLPPEWADKYLVF